MYVFLFSFVLVACCVCSMKEAKKLSTYECDECKAKKTSDDDKRTEYCICHVSCVFFVSFSAFVVSCCFFGDFHFGLLFCSCLILFRFGLLRAAFVSSVFISSLLCVLLHRCRR